MLPQYRGKQVLPDLQTIQQHLRKSTLTIYEHLVSRPLKDFLTSFEANQERNLVSINSQDNNGNTLLHAAAKCSKAEIVNTLCVMGASVNVKNKKGQTPLHLAVISKSTECIGKLFCHFANLDVQDEYGKTPLHLAAGMQQGQHILVNLLDLGANLLIPDYQGRIPLHYAVINNRVGYVYILLDRKYVDVYSSLSAKDSNGRAALLHAIEVKHWTFVEALILHITSHRLAIPQGYDVFVALAKAESNKLIQQLTTYDLTTLCSANEVIFSIVLSTRNIELLGYLYAEKGLKIPASISLENVKECAKILLAEACRSYKFGMVKAFFTNQTILNVDDTFYYGSETPFMYFVKSGHINGARAFAELNCDVNVLDINGWNACHYAVNTSDHYMLDTVLAAGCRQTIVPYYFGSQRKVVWSHVGMALYKGSYRCVNILMKYIHQIGMNNPILSYVIAPANAWTMLFINVNQCEIPRTRLIDFFSLGFLPPPKILNFDFQVRNPQYFTLDVLQILIKFGLDIYGRNEYDENALFSAINNCLPFEIIEFLLLKGVSTADLNIRGDTPMDALRKSTVPLGMNTVKLLIEYDNAIRDKLVNLASCGLFLLK